jgi:hypothetical protein
MLNNSRDANPVRDDGERVSTVAVGGLRPALADIRGAIDYLGRPSRSKFYADLLPHLNIVRFGARTFVTVASLDRLIASHRQPSADRP